MRRSIAQSAIRITACAILPCSAIVFGVWIGPALRAQQQNPGFTTATATISLALTTLNAPLYSKWLSKDNNSDTRRIKAQAQSDADIQKLRNGDIDLVETELGVSEDDLREFAMLQIPTAVTGVAAIWNIPGLTTSLSLSGEALSGIFLGEISGWDDPAIAGLNPGLKLPALKISPVHRSDFDGTTYRLTDYLSSFDERWRGDVGQDGSTKWPNEGLAAAESDGVAELVRRTPGAIGYVAVPYAIKNKLRAAKIRNLAGLFVAPEFRNLEAAAVGSLEKEAYPILGLTSLLVSKRINDPNKQRVALGFLSWILSSGQRIVQDAGYAPLPKVMVDQEVALLSNFVPAISKAKGDQTKSKAKVDHASQKANGDQGGPKEKTIQRSSNANTVQARAKPNKFDARGISVGVPKAFDNATLTGMLETLKTQLSKLQPIDPSSINKAVGNIQGSQTQDSSQTLTIQGPSVAPSGSQPTSQPSPQQNQPLAPTSLQYGMSASDLLTEQLDLAYQAANVEMLLDRSLTDRIKWNEKGGAARLQAVIGLNVTLDPPRDAENSVAVVEVTLYEGSRAQTQTPAKLSENGDCLVQTQSRAEPSERRPSLVAVMPQEHTYNSAALSAKSTAFGGSAAFKIINVGYTQTKRGQTFYLFRDNDTVSFERQVDPDREAITFGWAFRPVLGRKSVSPGPRQMFAVISLPEEDCGEHAPVILRAAVKAYWRKYNAASLTTDYSAIRPVDGLLDALRFGTVFSNPRPGETNVGEYDVQVPYTSSYLKVLSPTIEKVRWRFAGDKQAVVSVEGKNLYQGTKVALGDKVFDASMPALRLQPDKAFDITTDLTALRSDGVVLGRYGAGVPLEAPPKAVSADLKSAQLSITVCWDASLGGVTPLSIYPYLQTATSSLPLPSSWLDDGKLGQPIASIKGTGIPGPYEVITGSKGKLEPDHCRSKLQDPTDAYVDHFLVAVPDSLTKDISGVIQLKFPFKGNQFVAWIAAYDPKTKFSVTLGNN